MDRFVSISEVHSIVKDSLMELYDKLAASHRLAKSNQIEIARMDTELGERDSGYGNQDGCEVRRYTR